MHSAPTADILLSGFRNCIVFLEYIKHTCYQSNLLTNFSAYMRICFDFIELLTKEYSRTGDVKA